MLVEAGDLLLTRNAGGEEANESPGYYNHSAIIGPLNWVIEAQKTPNCVIAVPVWHFFDRYPEIMVLRCNNPATVARTLELAPQYVGRTYDTYMTIRPFWRWRNSDSCISLLRRIYNAATGYDYKWRIPDSLLEVEWLEKKALKKDYENYVEPESHHLGMQKVWPNTPADSYYPQ
jgi:hypothetical protein